MRPGFADVAVQALSRLAQFLRQRFHHRAVFFQGAADHFQCFPEAFLEDFRFFAGLAALVGAFAAGQHRDSRVDKRLKRLEKPIRAQTVAGAMGCLARDPVLPAFAGTVDDGCRLIVRQAESPSLGRGDLVEIHAVRDQDGIPVVQQRKFNRVPLDVFAGCLPVAADLVGIDRSLIPVHVQDRVFQADRAGGSHGFADPPRGHPTLPLDDVDTRRTAAVIIHGAEGQPQRGSNTDPRRAGGQAQERSGRGRMAVEGLDPVFQEERCFRQGITPKTEQIFQTELVLFVLGESSGQPMRITSLRRAHMAYRPSVLWPAAYDRMSASSRSGLATS